METVSGQPTKEFFIHMLTRDITVSDAIGDLVDNSVDAARKKIYLDSQKETLDLFTAKYETTTVSINVNENSFIIKDNAGGIPFEIAQKYAFCFGRPDEYDGTPGSIGQFGIGMKRAFFKIGKKISVESFTESTYFKVEIDVDIWKKSSDWDFEVTDKQDSKAKQSSTGYGTTITITELHSSTVELFKDIIYLNKLKEEIGLENWYNLSKGMNLKINDVPLNPKDLTIKQDSTIGLSIGRWQHQYDTVNVRIICGIGERDKKEDGGWYIFCNDRLILPHDQTSLTGWGGEDKKVNGGPEYHGQFQLFRGFVFFESQDPKNFPWNTSKTGINSEDIIYVHVKAKMVAMMKEVITFLNAMKSEKDGQGRKNKVPSPTEIKLESAKSFSIKEIAQPKLTPTKFTAPETIKPTKVQPNGVLISYNVDSIKFDLVVKQLNRYTPTDVGLETFNYYYNNEIGDER